MAEFAEALALEDLPPGASRLVRIADTEVAVFNVDGEVFAINDTCVHQGASLAAGKVSGKVVTCVAHGFRYDLTTGDVVGSPGFGVASYPVKIEDGMILIGLS
jgi:nitrite reductase/ring-hydroxylating ferredoxin subunit